MRNVLIIAGKEIRSYFNSTIAYIFMVVFLVLTALLFFELQKFFVIGQATLRDFFGLVPIVMLFFVPAISMRMWAEERKLGTLETLMTLPLRDGEVVLGKFLAGLAFLLITLALTFPLPVIVSALGNPDSGALFCGYLGLVLLGASYLAIGLWISSLTENQIVAFVTAAVACLILFIIGVDVFLTAVPSWLVPFLKGIALGSRFSSIERGVIDLRDIVYYLSIIGFFLFLNMRSVELRKGA
ncbi:MAG: ABC transporter permease subunit [Candidatus Eisenbacteria bacterium]|uniref:ABC transporter permease subunit n=1 Tax=Eiseniibacteriota bacterium TaxID=2212470 RepID=A0A937XAG0_UNCEI|nr:ABC transporter permease subunit [Candidatus Eisenbacteria bacterium]